MGEILNRRRVETDNRVEALRIQLERAEGLCGDTSCVYMTGSFARGEASAYSDLDLFIAGQGTPEAPKLSRLNQIIVKADLIETSRKLAIPDFSADGEYLTHHTVGGLIGTLGKPDDDANNTFTARLLLLLESTALIGKSAYYRIVSEVIEAYWRDYSGNENKFIPAFLANDVLRMWRTFCVNYEARTKSVPPDLKAKRSVKNYKLKHSRLLTCYSGLLYLLSIFSMNDTVSPRDAENMVALTPTKRLEWMVSQPELANAKMIIEKLIAKYELFLENTNVPEGDLVRRFLNKQDKQKYWESVFEFGDLVFAVFNEIGKGNRFHRLLVV